MWWESEVGRSTIIKAQEQKSPGLSLYSTLSVIWSCLSNVLSLEHIYFLFLSICTYLSCLSKPTLVLPISWLLPAHTDLSLNLRCDPHLSRGSNCPLVLALWVCTSDFLWDKVLPFRKDGIMSESVVFRLKNAWITAGTQLVSWLVYFELIYIKLGGRSKDIWQQ